MGGREVEFCIPPLEVDQQRAEGQPAHDDENVGYVGGDEVGLEQGHGLGDAGQVQLHEVEETRSLLCEGGDVESVDYFLACVNRKIRNLTAVSSSKIEQYTTDSRTP